MYSFAGTGVDPAPGASISLDVRAIEDAGLREVLQTPGARYGTWSILDGLLEPTGSGSPFMFKAPLGQAREVKVALSGLFGRFVARAYLEQYLHLSIFAHLGTKRIILDGRRAIEIVRLSKGDLPDWVACASDLSGLTVAEAKGCHDPGGPTHALARAWVQVHRVDVTAKRRKLSVKRIAIATRWGMTQGGPADSHLSVHDPDEDGEAVGPEDKDAAFVGLLRLHIASLLEPLGHGQLADALRGLTRYSLKRRGDENLAMARSLLDSAPVREMEKAEEMGDLVGGIVTRAGPVTDRVLSVTDQETLARLDLRPVYVGIERELIRAAIDSDAQAIRGRLSAKITQDGPARADRAGGWIIPLGSERQVRGHSSD